LYGELLTRNYIMAPPSASTSPTATKYKGHCHCGAFRYVATFPRPLAPTPHSLSAPSDPATATADESTRAKCIPEAEKEGGNSKTAAEATVTKVGSLGLNEEVTEEQASEDKSQIASCNCSICQRNGYLIVHLCKDDVEITRGKMEDLSTYEFGLVSHHYLLLFGQAGEERMGARVRGSLLDFPS
jgi:hypothetical protein